MKPKTDKEDTSCDDIAFLSEIIANYRYWQEVHVTCRLHSIAENPKLLGLWDKGNG